MAIGTFLFGVISDANGRKGSIPVAMVIIFCASITLSFAQTMLLINLSVFILGLGLAGNNVTLRVYLIEFLPMKQRGSCLVILDILGNVGYISALGLSWLLMPSIIRFQNKRFRLNSWRVLAGLGGIPNLIMACIVSLLPASPRYLLYRRRQEEALTVLQQIYAINNSKHADTYPISSLDNCVQPDDEDEDDIHNSFRTILKFFMKTYKRIQLLYKPQFRRVTMLGMCLGLLQIPGIVWLALWNARLLHEFENLDKPIEKNSTCMINIESMALGILHNCQDINTDYLRRLSYLFLCYILGGILLLAGIDIIGRKVYLVFAGIMGATASLILLLRIHSTVRIVLSSIILSTYAIGCTTTLLLILENYSTGLRGTIVGLTRLLPYLIAGFIKLFLNIHCIFSIIFISGILLSATIAGSRMPDLTRLPMRE
ncbi:synaptic vesicle glycoprotein 2A [Calliopsis andreniformis]|uniref:synaptic vesicle glycoprotein 2A n=1 Tax=Calliopsis andreniformis TaxID=337506 RepID=UPI003FCCDAFB